MLPMKFGVNWLFGSGEEAKNRLQDGRQWPSWISILMILAVFDLQVILMLPTKFRVKWLRGVGGVSNC